MQYKKLLSIVIMSLVVSHVSAEAILHEGSLETPAFIGQIQAHTSEEVSDILTRLDGLLNGDQSFPSEQPLALVLHGNEAAAFLQKNYTENKSMVDLAARLDAFNAVDIQICETWMRLQSVTRDELPAFVDTVPFGPAKEAEFIENGFIYF